MLLFFLLPSHSLLRILPCNCPAPEALSQPLMVVVLSPCVLASHLRRLCLLDRRLIHRLLSWVRHPATFDFSTGACCAVSCQAVRHDTPPLVPSRQAPAAPSPLRHGTPPLVPPRPGPTAPPPFPIRGGGTSAQQWSERSPWSRQELEGQTRQWGMILQARRAQGFRRRQNPSGERGQVWAKQARQ